MRGPNPRGDLYRAEFRPDKPISGVPAQINTGFQRTLGGDGIAINPGYPWQNPIGNGIVWTQGLPIDGGPVADYQFGTFFFIYPSQGMPISTAPTPGGPLIDPATLAAYLGAPAGANYYTTAAAAAAMAAQQRMGNFSTNAGA
jgi:hypothetical protein